MEAIDIVNAIERRQEKVFVVRKHVGASCLPSMGDYWWRKSDNLTWWKGVRGRTRVACEPPWCSRTRSHVGESMQLTTAMTKGAGTQQIEAGADEPRLQLIAHNGSIQHLDSFVTNVADTEKEN